MDLFLKKASTPIVIKNGNRISYEKNWEEQEFIQMYSKSADIPLKEILLQQHFNSGTKLNEENYFAQKIIIAPS